MRILRTELVPFDDLDIGTFFLSVKSDQDPLYANVEEQPLKFKEADGIFGTFWRENIETLYFAKINPVLPIIGPNPQIPELDEMLSRIAEVRTDIPELELEPFSGLANNASFFLPRRIGSKYWLLETDPMMIKSGDITYRETGMPQERCIRPEVLVITESDLETFFGA